MLKIISGKYRSRMLASPPDADVTRPYTSRVRESVFGMLHGWFEGASVLDLFAGVGTVGLEAVSRGARTVLMVEQDRRICEILEQNIASLGCGEQAVTLRADALGSVCLMRADAPVDLIFVDPPYTMMEDPLQRQRVLQQIERCRDIMGDAGFIVLRTPVRPQDADYALAGFDGPEPHRYGHGMWVLLYAPAARPEPAESSPRDAAS